MRGEVVETPEGLRVRSAEGDVFPLHEAWQPSEAVPEPQVAGAGPFDRATYQRVIPHWDDLPTDYGERGMELIARLREAMAADGVDPDTAKANAHWASSDIGRITGTLARLSSQLFAIRKGYKRANPEKAKATHVEAAKLFEHINARLKRKGPEAAGSPPSDKGPVPTQPSPGKFQEGSAPAPVPTPIPIPPAPASAAARPPAPSVPASAAKIEKSLKAMLARIEQLGGEAQSLDARLRGLPPQERATEATAALIEQLHGIQTELRQLNEQADNLRVERHRAEWTAGGFYGKPEAPPGPARVTAKALKAQKEFLLAALDKAIEAAPAEGGGKITIEVPGDGTWTIANDKQRLRQFREMARKGMPTSTSTGGGPAQISVKARGAAKIGKPTPPEMVEALARSVSDDPDRVVLHFAYADGTQIVATDGRTLTRIVTDKAPGKPSAPVLLDPSTGKVDAEATAKYRFPNFKQIIPTERDLLKGRVDTLDVYHIARQALVFHNATEDVKGSPFLQLYINLDGSLGGRLEVAGLGDTFEHNVTEGARLVGLYDAEYLVNLMNLARALGNSHVDLYRDNDPLLSLIIRGESHESLIMPGRGEKGATLEPRPNKDFAGDAGKPEHEGSLPPPLDVVANPDADRSQHVPADRAKGIANPYDVGLGQGVITIKMPGSPKHGDREVGRLNLDEWKGNAQAKLKLIVDLLEKFHGAGNSSEVAAREITGAVDTLVKARARDVKGLKDREESGGGAAAMGDLATGENVGESSPAEGLADPGVGLAAPATGRLFDNRLPVTLDQTTLDRAAVPQIMKSLAAVIEAAGGTAPIRVGRFNTRRARGVYMPRSEVIRLNSADNIPTGVHEVGHALQAQLYGTAFARVCVDYRRQ